MAISEETLELAIPSSLKTEHPDSGLLVQGILIALRSNENSTALTARGRMMAVHDALDTIFAPMVRDHLSKEDEDWNALKAKADKYRPTVTIAVKRERPEFAQYTYGGEEFGTIFAMRGDDGNWTAEAMSSGGVQSQQTEGFPSARAAARDLFEDRGIMVLFESPTDEAQYKPASSAPRSDKPKTRLEQERERLASEQLEAVAGPNPPDPREWHVNYQRGKECPVCGGSADTTYMNTHWGAKAGEYREKGVVKEGGKNPAGVWLPNTMDENTGPGILYPHSVTP